MRYAVLLLCSVLIVGTSAVAQTAPASSTAANTTHDAIAIPPAHPITLAQAKEILKMTGADQMKNQMIESMMAELRHAFPPYMPEDVIEDFQTSLEKADLDDTVIPIYQKYLSQQDAAAIIAFYKTPAGQHMLTALPEISRESQQAGALLGEKVVREVIERHKAEIEAAAKKYQEMHSLSSQP